MADDYLAQQHHAPPPPLLTLIQWDKIHHSPPPAAAVVSPPLVSITNHSCSNSNPPIIFPPANHENLQIHIHTDNSSPLFNQQTSDSDSESDSTNSNSSSSFSPSESSPISHHSRPIKSMPAADWFASIVQSKFNRITRYVWNILASSPASACTAAAVVALMYLRRRRRLRVVEEESRTRLVGAIKHRDEKIKQLLEQISEMNQVLLKHHRRAST